MTFEIFAMDKTRVQHIFFDLDNTLWDHRGNSELTLEQMFSDYQLHDKYQVSFNDWHQEFYDHNELLWDSLREGKITKDQLRQRRFQEPFDQVGIQEVGLGEEFENVYLQRMGHMKGTVAGAKELLAYLHPNYTLHIITNGFIEVSEDKLKNADLQQYITTLTCADEIGVRKPDPRIFELAMQKANAPKENSLIVGDDWIADIIGGTSFGWQAIFLDCFNTENKLDQVPNIKSLVEIKDLL